jgi:hypothetical protein
MSGAPAADSIQSIAQHLPSELGFAILVIVVLGVLLSTAVADFVFALRRRPPIGQYVNAFVRNQIWVAGMVALVFGAMIAHFFFYINHG